MLSSKDRPGDGGRGDVRPARPARGAGPRGLKRRVTFGLRFSGTDGLIHGAIDIFRTGQIVLFNK